VVTLVVGTVLIRKMTMKNKILELSLSDIEISDWDVRRFKEEVSELEALTQSIKRDGLLNPLTVIQLDGRYILVAGRRRLKACKALGYEKVPVFVKNNFNNNEKTELRKITLIENIHRRGLKDSERSYGILAVYESAGYTQDQAIQGTKSIDNWFSDKNHKGSSWDDFRNSVPKQEHINTSPLRYDEKFVEICQSIGYTPKYQYQLLQLTRDMPEKILVQADQAGLSTNDKIVLTNTKLRKHPRLQKEIITKLAEKKDDNVAKELVYQTASDLETGALEKSGKSYIRRDSKRDKISNNQTEILPSQKGIKITSAAKKLIFQLTDIQIPRNKIRYDDTVVTRGKGHMTSVVKSVSDSELVSIYENLDIVKKSIEQIQSLIDDEFKSRDMKKDLTIR
jgi:ParB/RepB/Spo0J family partition protein